MTVVRPTTEYLTENPDILRNILSDNPDVAKAAKQTFHQEVLYKLPAKHIMV
jgi:hypothetical protein